MKNNRRSHDQINRKAYRQPKLTSYGTLKELTTGASVATHPENHEWQIQKARP